MITVENEAVVTLGQRIKRLRELEFSPAWRDEIIPQLQSMLDDYIEQAIDPIATAEQRTLNISAIHAIREIINLPQTAITHLEAQAKSQRKHLP